MVFFVDICLKRLSFRGDVLRFWFQVRSENRVLDDWCHLSQSFLHLFGPTTRAIEGRLYIWDDRLEMLEERLFAFSKDEHC